MCIPDSALEIHSEITSALEKLLALDCSTPLAPRFRSLLADVRQAFERYQRAVVLASRYRLRCQKGCCHCCNHWVDNVHSFEAELIAEHLRRVCPADIPTISDRLASDELEFASIRQRLTRGPTTDGTAAPLDLAFERFYRLGRPCALLDASGSCRVYSIRPMMCRIYISFSDPEWCHASNPHHDQVLTYLLDLEEEADQALDRLGRRFQRFGNDTSLRSLLAKSLRQGA